MRISGPDPAALSIGDLGRLGEKLAARWLRRHGFRVLRQNFRAPRGGEVDVVCRDKSAGELVFIEVKTRRSLAFGAPEEAVTAEKRRLIERGAQAWLRMLGNPDIIWRYDIVEVVFSPGARRPEISLIRDAFRSDEIRRERK